jgi:arylsulfatase A-like enzyme
MSGKGDRKGNENSAVDRRKVLLGGATIAASAFAAATPVQTAQAQQRPATPTPAAGQKPNILFIMGDDIGWLYDLNAEEEPENPDCPKDPEFKKRFSSRGVLKSSSDGKIENTGPLTKRRMETIDEEFLGAAKNFINRQHRANRPWF